MPLVLDLLRHGEALPAAAGGDAERPLSPLGERAISRLADTFVERGWRPERAFTSPLRRARESARILLARAAPGLEAEVLESLAGSVDPAELFEDLVALGLAQGHALLVGHQPFLGLVVTHWTDGSERPLPPGGLIRLEFPSSFVPGTARISLELGPAK